MAKFKVGDEVAVAAIMKIAAIQPQRDGSVSYSTDRGITIHETLMEQIALVPKEPKAEEPKPAPQPAHRFKVGDRVDTEYGIGEIVYICNEDLLIPYLVYNENWVGCSGYLAKGFDVTKRGMHCRWFHESNLSPAPAPEPPKYYTGKVVCVEWKGEIFRHKSAGRIAVITNGICDYAGWNRLFKPFESFSDFCSANIFGVFCEIKE